MSVLAAMTKTTVPTIHHYRRLGLLPDATTVASNRFLYDERHVEALLLIRELRVRRGLSLDAIHEVLPELLVLGHDDAFRPERWDEALAAHCDPGEAALVASRLVSVAREAFSQHGYAGVNVGDLCDAAGIAKGTFYRYYESKEAVFVAAARSTVDAVGSELDEDETPMNEAQAAEKLQYLLGPLAPLLLEVAIGELRHQPNVGGVVAAIAAGLAARLVPRLVSKGSGASAARRVVDSALVGLLQPALGQSSTPA